MIRLLVRRHGEKLFGHTTVRAQLGWCHEANVRRAIFTHCGSQILEPEQNKLDLKLRAMGREQNVDARFADDALEVVLR